MKYKTLFRLILKVIGVYFFFQGLTTEKFFFYFYTKPPAILCRQL